MPPVIQDAISSVITFANVEAIRDVDRCRSRLSYVHKSKSRDTEYTLVTTRSLGLLQVSGAPAGRRRAAEVKHESVCAHAHHSLQSAIIIWRRLIVSVGSQSRQCVGAVGARSHDELDEPLLPHWATCRQFGYLFKLLWVAKQSAPRRLYNVDMLTYFQSSIFAGNHGLDHLA